MDPNHPTRLRLEDQLAWMGSKAAAAQRMHKRLKILQVISAALIPFVTGWQIDAPHLVGSMPFSSFLAGFLGVVVVLLMALQQTGKYQENWLNYRQTVEALKSERHLHEVGAGAYQAATDPDRLFAERIEDILQRENQAWVSHTKRQAAG